MHRRIFPALILALLLAAPAPHAGEAEGKTAVQAATTDVQVLVPEPKQALVEQIVTRLLTKYHYADKPLDDAMSSAIFERYLASLDNSRSYLLASDIRAFEGYRTTLDDALMAGDLGPAYEMYNVYRQRLKERIAHARQLLKTKPDFTLDEEFIFDRADAPWPEDAEAANELWRTRVKNDLIGLMLTGKTWEESRDLLATRYDNFLRRSGQVNSEDVFDTFMNAYALSLDPHTVYMSPRDSEEFEIRMSLTYEGIGAALQTEGEYVKIVRILPGGAAAKSGALKPDDRITAVAQGSEGKPTDVIGWRLDDVVDLIRGPKDSIVRLLILPANAPPGTPPKELSLVRSEIQLEEQAAQAEMLEIKRGDKLFKVGVVTVPAFYLDYRARMEGSADYRSTTRDVRKLIADLKARGMEGLVIDLRNNGGGSLQEATELTGLFIKGGPVVQVRAHDGGIDIADDPEPDMAWDGPLSVLVNRFSASASEIFAGAIQDYGRGIVVGSTTYGKGTVQNLVDLNRFLKVEADLGQIKMTVGKFYRITGSSTQHEGVHPDIMLPSTVDLSEYGESTEPSALPWDRIDAATEGLLADGSNLIPQLTSLHEQRVRNAHEFDLLHQEIAESRELRARKSISLNLAERRKEMQREEAQRLARLNEWRKTQGQAPLASLDELPDDAGEPDVLLRESAEILTDLIALRNGTLEPVLAATGTEQ